MADLTGLNLLRNDPEAAARLIAEAEQGDVDAQYAAGLIYAEGRGVDVDLVQAYFWLTRALDQGDSDAEILRQTVAAQMPDAEFDAARRLVEAARRAEPVRRDGDGNPHVH
ncbi:MAG: sel1 repeat family protein [Gammaproteobacteria bacterium]|nr:sel1 repeat family protein [Gammaproteobacteria bacterium]